MLFWRVRHAVVGAPACGTYGLHRPGTRLNCVDADTTSPTVVISSDAVAPVTGPFSIAIAFSEPVTGFELADLDIGNGSESALRGTSSSYSATITPAASGAVTVDTAARAAENDAGNPTVAADQFSIVADLTQVPMNRPPVPAATPPNRTLAPDETLNVDVSGAFVDPDGDALSFTASSTVPRVVTASVTGTFVMLAAASEGPATIRVTATDPGGLSATQPFTVTVEVSASEPFADHPIRPGVTPVKAIHFTELRERIGALRRAVDSDQRRARDGVAGRGGGTGGTRLREVSEGPVRPRAFRNDPCLRRRMHGDGHRVGGPVLWAAGTLRNTQLPSI